MENKALRKAAVNRPFTAAFRYAHKAFRLRTCQMLAGELNLVNRKLHNRD